MTLLFIKRLNDTFEENAEKLVKEEGKSEKEAYGNKNRHYFFIPKEARWSVLSQTSENIGEKIDQVCRIIERENPDLDGVLTNTTYNDKRKFPDDRLRKLISHFNSPRLRNSDLESTDIFGDAFEYLLEQFADETKKSGGNFFTPKEIVRLLVNLVEPKEGMSICDPTCGSGGMLIESMKYVSQHGGNPRNLVLEGQESNYGTVGMCKINMVLHGLVDFRIEYGDTLSNPKLVEGGKLKTYDRVVANFPFSMDWDNKIAARDPYNRFRFGIPPEKGKADFAFIQHMFGSLNERGQAAIICSHGVLFRGNEEAIIREGMIREDIIEAVIALPKKLFYGTSIPGIVLILNRNKPKNRKNKIIFIYAARGFEEAEIRNKLRDVDIEKVVSAFKEYKEIEGYCHISDLDELNENEFNLNVSRYIDASSPNVDIKTTARHNYDVLANTYQSKESYYPEFPTVKFSEIMHENTESIIIDDSKEYVRITVKLHGQGVVFRDVRIGKKIKTKRQKVTKAGQFIVAELDAKFGAFGIIPKKLEGSIVSSHYWLFDLDNSKILPEYFDYVVRNGPYEKLIIPSVKGTTNYAAPRPKHILALELPLPSLEEQRKIVQQLDKQLEIRETATAKFNALLKELIIEPSFKYIQKSEKSTSHSPELSSIQKNDLTHYLK